MNDALPPCPECSSGYSYEMGALLVGPECGHEWGAAGAEEQPAGEQEESGPRGIKDGVGDHDIDCKVDGVGPMELKSSVVKKV